MRVSWFHLISRAGTFILLSLILCGMTNAQGVVGNQSTARLPLLRTKQTWQEPRNRRFFLLSTGVYAAASMDMQESASLRPHFHEDDPLAKPFAKLPLPAYYAHGIGFATSMNWLGWKMARSERWHRVWWLPQVCSIAGNLIGYGHTKTHEHRR